MTENMEAPKNNPFKQEDMSVVEQVNGVKSAKVKEDKDSTYSVKITNTHGSSDASLKKVDKLTDVDEGKGFTNDDNEVLEKVLVTGEKGSDKKDVGKKVEKVLNKKGTGVSEGQYSYEDNEAVMKTIGSVLDTITYFVAAVAGISLFIAGIGVMNVMYISVTERTEEIAIRRAFGAKGRDIEIQFLVESVVLCLIGGIIGLILGIIIATLIDLVTPEMVKSSVSLGSVILAVGVSTLIGIIFGWIPARSASKKELIDIIK